MNEKISVIMSTYNTPRDYLKESIESILGQTYTNLELIIICDGTKDEYQYILSNYKDEKVKVLLNRQNKGLAYSLNRGISESSGQYIARMDSDDISLPNRLTEELDYLKRNKLDLCGTAAYSFGDKYDKKSRLFISPEGLKIWMLFMATLIHPSVLGKKELFLDNKYNESYLCAQDFELWSRIIDNYRIGYCSKPLLRYRIHDKQITTKKGQLQRQMAEKIIRKNATKISGMYDEKVFRCLWLLGGRERIKESNCKELNELIDYVLVLNHTNKKYDEKLMKKIFYSRFFELVLKYRIAIHDFAMIKKIVRLNNLKDMAFYGTDKILSKFRKNIKL